jgi:hypothetical protein
LTAADAEKVRELVFSGGTALAGLILVFLGAIFTSFDGFQPRRRNGISSSPKKRDSSAEKDRFEQTPRWREGYSNWRFHDDSTVREKGRELVRSLAG